MKLRIKNENSFVRDSQSGAIVNINNNDLRAYKQRRDRDIELTRLKENYTKIESDINTIKQLLQSLVEKNSK